MVKKTSNLIVFVFFVSSPCRHNDVTGGQRGWKVMPTISVFHHFSFSKKKSPKILQNNSID